MASRALNPIERAAQRATELAHKRLDRAAEIKRALADDDLEARERWQLEEQLRALDVDGAQNTIAANRWLR